MSWIVALAGYNPEKEGRKPRRSKKRIKQKPADQSVSLAQRGVQMNKVTKKPEVYNKVDESEHEWQTVGKSTDFGQISPELTPQEREYFATTKNFVLSKAEILKVSYAAGLSPRETADQYLEKGYSYDNVRRYFKAFSRLKTTPLPAKEGSAPPPGGNSG